MEEKRKGKISRIVVKNIAAVLSQVFAMTMALILVMLSMRYVVLHEHYGSYMISPYEKVEDFQDTQTFRMVFQRELMTLSHYLALSSQLEENGIYNPNRKVDVFEYVKRKEVTNPENKEYPKLVYRIGDLIEWAQYGIGMSTYEVSYDEAKKYLSDEEIKQQFMETTGIYVREPESIEQTQPLEQVDESEPVTQQMDSNETEYIIMDDGYAYSAEVMEETGYLLDAYKRISMKDCIYSVSVLDEEFKPQNVQSIYDLKLPEGVTTEAVISAIQQTASDLDINYDEYLNKKEMLSADSNFKYMFVNSLGQVVYTNLENKENISVDDLKEAFKSCKTHMIYDYMENELTSNNLLLNHEPYYKGYFRDYSYCFPQGGTVYAAIQTKSSSAFGPYNSEDFYASANENLTATDASWEEMIGFAVLLGIFAMITLIVFIACQPKKKREELAYFDTWFTEIAVAFAIATTCAVIGIGAIFADLYASRNMFDEMTSEQYSRGFIISIYVTFVFLYAMFLLYMGSLVRRIKAKALWKGSLCYYLLHNTKKICGKVLSLIRKVIEALVNHKLFFVRTFGPYCLFLFVNAACILVFEGSGIILAFIFDVAVAAYLYFENKAREEIVAGISRICDGDVEYQIDTKRFFGENKVIAEAVNKIGEAVKNAVQISMKDERLKTDLITNVSHDIKTPLTSIINYVDLLKRENIQGEKAQEYIRILDEKSQRLKQLTLDLVEASKISSGNITLEMSDIDVKELLKQAVGEYEDKMEEKKLVLVETYPQQENMVIHADSRRMWRVVENLLVNICKYSMEGTRVYVDVATLRGAMSDIGTDSSAHLEMVEITFKNISAQPLNIPAEELTERFIRGDVSRSTEGSGLGLSIAQNLTVAQGGEFKIHLDGDLFKVVLRFPRK